MSLKFFLAQWENPVAFDWTLEVKKNLSEFGLSTDLEEIKRMSKNSFKNLVKKHAKCYEFLRLLKIKESKSKMKNLLYTEFKLQDYLLLRNMNISEAKAHFKFRVRMAPFGQNFKGGQVMIVCPFCGEHADGQEESWKCRIIRKIIDIKGEYQDIFGQIFSQEIVKSVLYLYNFREEFRKL